ncbi:MAG: hypothetical protein AAF697_04065 [Pseudomonadota bacterium]
MNSGANITRSPHRPASRAGLAYTALLPVILLSACDAGGASGGPGAVSEGEARALDEAAEMLEERRLRDGVLPETGAESAATEQSLEQGESE